MRFCSPLPRNKSLCRNIHTNYFVISPLRNIVGLPNSVIFVGHVLLELVCDTFMTIVVSLITRLNRRNFSQNTCRLVALNFINCYRKRETLRLLKWILFSDYIKFKWKSNKIRFLIWIVSRSIFSQSRLVFYVADFHALRQGSEDCHFHKEQ